MTGLPATVTELLELAKPLRRRAEMALVAPYLDAEFYLTQTREWTKDEVTDPVEHFCTIGWKYLLKPSRTFDTWWYWANYLEPGEDQLNPLAHYALEGRAQGNLTRPHDVSAGQRTGHRLAPGAPVRRAFLLAGFDKDFIVDDSVIRLATELDRWGDVFYLADNYLPDSELAKLAGITRGAWAFRHGSYDFGSYAALARDLVGWEALESYDEVVFVNDSNFLLRPLDDVFAAMDARECDWWGLQATKGLASTSSQPSNAFTEPIAIDEVRAGLVDSFEDDVSYDFHVGSYFLVFRRPVIADARFRALIESIHPQPGKLSIVQKYEVGLTHLLLGRGYRFDTFITQLYPFHPIFTESYYELVQEGFPFLKRYFIYENHYDVPEMATWKERITALVPDAPVDDFEKTLIRSAPDDRLRRSMAVRRKADGSIDDARPLRAGKYRRKDARTAKDPQVWAFAVDPFSGRLPADSRAIFEAVKDDASLTKVILTRGQRPDLAGTNIVVEPVRSAAGQEQLRRAGLVLVNNRPRATVGAPVRSDRQTVVAVRDGLLLERRGRTLHTYRETETTFSPRGPLPVVHPEPPAILTGLLAASDVDRLAALATIWPARFDQAWMTGLPGHDFLLGEEDSLPQDYLDQVAEIRAMTGGRPLVLFAPAYRSQFSSRLPLDFSPQQVAWLQSWTERNGVVLGLRESERSFDRPLVRQLGSFALDLSAPRFRDSTPVLRAAAAVLTDYDGLALDASVAGKPVASFAYDLPEAHDGLLYDLDHFFPGTVAQTFEELQGALESLLAEPVSPRHERIRTMLVDRRDAQNTERVLHHLRTITAGVTP